MLMRLQGIQSKFFQLQPLIFQPISQTARLTQQPYPTTQQVSANTTWHRFTAGVTTHTMKNICLLVPFARMFLPGLPQVSVQVTSLPELLHGSSAMKTFLKAIPPYQILKSV